jgi:branched-chain amino acid transport system ATP-binding protein
MRDAVLHVDRLSKSFGAVQASKDVTLTLVPGEIHALIGPNGAGKSTLIKQIAGGLRPDSGTVTFLGQDVTRLDTVARARMGLGRSFQVSAVVGGYTVLQNVMLALHGRDRSALRPFAGAMSRRARVEEAQAHAARTAASPRISSTVPVAMISP